MKILIVYYSMYGYTLQLARTVEEGARTVAGAEVILRRVLEFSVVDKAIDQNEFARSVREQQKDIPVCTVDDLHEADGVIFGTPTRYDPRRTRDDTADDDGTAVAPENAHRRGAVFDAGHDSHGGPRRHTLWRDNHHRTKRRATANARGSGN